MKRILFFFVIALLSSAVGISARAGDDSDGGRPRFLGLGGTLGAPVAWYQNPDYHVVGCGVAMKIGVDFAHPVSDKFAVGVYAAIGGGPVFSKRVSGDFEDRNGVLPGIDVKVGLLMLVGDVCDRPFIIGVAPATGFGMCNPLIYLPAELRFGRLLSRHLYITGNLTTGVPLGYNDGTELSIFVEPSLTIGYNFGPKRR